MRDERWLRFCCLTLLAAAGAGCGATPDADWAEGHDELARSGSADLAVLYEPGADWGARLAPQVLELLAEGRAVSERQLGLPGDTPFHLVLQRFRGSSGDLHRFLSVEYVDAASGLAVTAFPCPVPMDGTLASDLASGNSLRDSDLPSLAAMRALALLSVHEMLHVLLARRVGPGPTHLWLEEGLAEILALKTGLSVAPDGAATLLRERLQRLKSLPADATIDFLRWSPGRGGGSYVERETREGREGVIEFGYGDPVTLRDAASRFRALARRHPESAALHESSAALLDESAGIAASPPGGHELAATSDDGDTRFHVYGALLAFLLDLEARGLDFPKLLAHLMAHAAASSRMGADGAARPQAVLLLTNAELLQALSSMVGEDISGLARRYSVAHAIEVLTRELDRIRR